MTEPPVSSAAAASANDRLTPDGLSHCCPIAGLNQHFQLGEWTVQVILRNVSVASPRRHIRVKEDLQVPAARSPARASLSVRLLPWRTL
jgi:hypothetical protein